jgi:hypothetical protein
MIAYLIAQIILVAFNFLNAQFDADRIKANKRIYHGINFGVYTLICAVICWIAHWNVGVITIFLVSAFCNRQLSFDIPLNIYRGLPWHYVSLAKPPKSITDRIEIRLFGYNGRAPVFMYAVIWVICLIIKMFV